MKNSIRASLVSLDVTVNAMLAQYPATAAILNAYGIDTCCGGELSVRQAATDASVDLELLHAMLEVRARPWSDPAGRERTT